MKHHPKDAYAPIDDQTSQTDDQRIKDITVLPPPEHLIRFFPIHHTPVEKLITQTRRSIHKILRGEDDRLLVVMGPCSIHDPAAAVDYARQLKVQREKYKDTLEIVMRVYFEKPDIVFHLAAFFANQNSIDHPESDLMTNGMGTLRLKSRASVAVPARGPAAWQAETDPSLFAEGLYAALCEGGMCDGFPVIAPKFRFAPAGASGTMISELLPHTGKSVRLGITGVPGVGKSTFIERFGLNLIESLAVQDLQELRLPILTTSSHQGPYLHEWVAQRQLPARCAWVLGHEGQGVQQPLIERAGLSVRIAQPGGEESLNVAAAAAICLYASATSH